MARLAFDIYGCSLFEVALSENKLDIIYQEICELNIILKQNNDICKLLSSPIIDKQSKDNIIINIFEQKVDILLFNFLRILAKNSRFNIFDKIVSKFKELYNDYKGIVDVIAITATPLSNELKNKLKDKISNSLSKQINIINNVDPNIIGGIKLQYKNNSIDASVKARIEDLRQQIRAIIV